MTLLEYTILIMSHKAFCMKKIGLMYAGNKRGQLEKNINKARTEQREELEKMMNKARTEQREELEKMMKKAREERKKKECVVS